MLAQKFFIIDQKNTGLPYAPYTIDTPIELLNNILDLDLFFDPFFTDDVLVFCEVRMTFGLAFSNKILQDITNRTNYGIGLILWNLEYSPEFVELFISLLNKWEQFIGHGLPVTENEEQFNNLLGEFKNISNIELVIQLLDSLMS